MGVASYAARPAATPSANARAIRTGSPAWATAVQPSYLAIGPVYPTTLKVMPYEPVGLVRLKVWAADAAPYPAVAIGGISLARLPGVLACGVNGVAVVSAVTLAADPRAAVAEALALCARAAGV